MRITVEISKRDIRMSAVVVGLLIAAAASVAVAAAPHTFQPNETLTADALNESFGNLETRLAQLERAPPNVVSATTTVEFETSSTEFVGIPGLSLEVTTTGRPLLLAVNGNFNPRGGTPPTSGYGRWAIVTITRNGENLGNEASGLQILSQQDEDNMPVGLTFVDAPPAGTYTYEVQVRNGEDGYTTLMGQMGVTQALVAVELR